MTDQFYLPHDVWNARAKRPLQHMVISIVTDVEGKAPQQDENNPKTLADRGREDLQQFHDWDLFVKGRDCDMFMPSVTHVKHYLENGMATRRSGIYVVMDKADKVRV